MRTRYHSEPIWFWLHTVLIAENLNFLLFSWGGVVAQRSVRGVTTSVCIVLWAGTRTLSERQGTVTSHSVVGVRHIPCRMAMWALVPRARGKRSLGSSPPVITVPVIEFSVSGFKFVSEAHMLAHMPMNNSKRNKHTRTLLLSCGLFIWDHNTFYPLGSVASREGREPRPVYRVGTRDGEQRGSSTTPLSFFLV